ncbi:MAG: SufD family Fe-S cluster assembly protein, partial [Bacteroidia bacterium]|nr:SufD family Fe-S cluster assembly protein [Bacteroidia bacterium]
MSAIIQENITQKFLAELSSASPKAEFTPFERIASALKFLEENGIPNNKHEDYKYCNVESIIRKEFKSLGNSFSPIKKEQLQKFRTDKNGIYFFIANGKIDEESSDLANLPAGLSVSSLTKAASENKEIFTRHFGAYANENKDAFIALNTAFCGDGIFIHSKKNSLIEKTIHLVYIDSAKENVSVNFRKLFVAEENSQVKISETFETSELPGKLFSNQLSEFYIGENCIVDATILQAGCENFYGVNSTQVFQEKKSNFSIHTFTFGGSLVRNNLNIVVGGEFAE